MTAISKHFDDREHWCLVKYINSKGQPDGSPWYYAGFYSKLNMDDESKPFMTPNFDFALKLHSREAAENLLTFIADHGRGQDWHIEPHAYYIDTTVPKKLDQHETEKILQERINNLKRSSDEFFKNNP